MPYVLLVRGECWLIAVENPQEGVLHILLQLQVGPNHVHVQPKNPSGRRTTSGRATSGRTASGRPISAGHQHGHKGNLLFRPLPAVPVEQEVASN